MSSQDAIFYLWDTWFATWFIAALWSDRPTSWLDFGSQALHWIITLIGIYLLLVVYTNQQTRVWNVGEQLGWVLLGLSATGLGFCWWARLYLGRLWSASVTRKTGHRIVDTGPYGIVRHPIYTGL